MFILKKGHQPGIYVPLRALFLVVFAYAKKTVFSRRGSYNKGPIATKV